MTPSGISTFVKFVQPSKALKQIVERLLFSLNLIFLRFLHFLNDLELIFVNELGNVIFSIESSLFEDDNISKEIYVEGILSPTGKIIKILRTEGVNADTIVDKQWDELINSLV